MSLYTHVFGIYDGLYRIFEIRKIIIAPTFCGTKSGGF
jgi:hypothetical protein